MILSVMAVTPLQADGNSDPSETISLFVGRSTLITSPWPVKLASVTDPEIANLEEVTARQFLVQAKSAGTTDIFLSSEGGESVRHVRVDVQVDVERIRSDLRRLFSDSVLDARQSGDVVMVTGKLARVEQSDRLIRFLDASGVKYVNMTTLAGVQQVQVQVRIAESSRVALRALGINALQAGHNDNTFFGASLTGSAAGGALNPVNIGPAAGTVAGIGGGTAVQPVVPFTFNSDVTVSPLVTLLAGFPRADLEFFIQALAENQYLRILAEPNLIALSGEEASFLAGGEFPVPVVQGTIGGAAGTSITIEYREFGVRLNFRPTVLGDNTIQLYVAPEVSNLTDLGAVEIQGFRIPALSMRRAETTLNLKSGQTFAMAGLLQETNEGRSSRVPGLGDLPIIGALFRSVRYERGETELLILVTATLVEPMSIDSVPPLPGDDHVVPNDWELYSEGRVEGDPRESLGAQADWAQHTGFDQLRGPGSWAFSAKPQIRHQAAAPPPGSLRANQGTPAADANREIPGSVMQ